MRLPARALALAGAVLGGAVALLAWAPASWLARGLASATAGRLLLTDTRGSVWNGSGVLVLSAGAEARDAAALPGRLRWTMAPQGLFTPALLLKASQDCCINGELRLRLSSSSIAVDNAGAGGGWLLRWPASVLAGLGTPWNTLQLGGTLQVQAQPGLRFERQGSAWTQAGRLDIDVVNLSSRVSTLAPLGSYRLGITGAAGGQGLLQLGTLEGALQLSGQGSFGGGSRLRFQGEASSAPGREAALDNLLNIIGRRQGARSVISIG